MPRVLALRGVGGAGCRASPWCTVPRRNWRAIFSGGDIGWIGRYPARLGELVPESFAPVGLFSFFHDVNYNLY